MLKEIIYYGEDECSVITIQEAVDLLGQDKVVEILSGGKTAQCRVDSDYIIKFVFVKEW